MNIMTIWWPQRGGANPGRAWFANLWTSTRIFWSEEALFRRCSAFKAQTRHGSVFQAAEVVMKAGRGQSGVSVLGGGFYWLDALFWLWRSCSSLSSKCKTSGRFSGVLGESCSPVMRHCADTHQWCPVPEDLNLPVFCPCLFGEYGL